jgi:hypothetical protein
MDQKILKLKRIFKKYANAFPAFMLFTIDGIASGRRA